MPFRRALSLAVLLLAAPWAGAVPVSAATVTITQTSPPATYKPPARAVDLLGIAPGMAPDKVAPILKETFGSVRVIQDNLGLEYRGIAVATQPYVTQMTAAKGGDQVTVWFGTPATGNAVVEISRQTNIFDPARAPELRQVRAELIAKYGPPAADQPPLASGEITVLAWSYNGDKLSPCPRSACRADVSEGLEVKNIDAYHRAVAAGHQLIIVATLLSSTDNPNRAASVALTISDMATKERTLASAVQQMRTAAVSARSKERE